MKYLSVFVLVMALAVSANAQSRYMTRSGVISFYSHTPVTDIEAINKQVSSILEYESNRIVFQVPIKGFEFEKALMQEHFNENYLESDQYPKASFDGQIIDLNKMDLSKAGEHTVVVKGRLTIHGEAKEIEEKGILIIDEDGNIQATSTFNLTVEDYKIEIPSIVRDEIAKEVEVKVNLLLKKA